MVVAAVTFIVLWEAGTSVLHVLMWPPGAGTLVAWLLLRRSLRRVRVSGRAFPGSWRRVLKRYVRDYTALPKDERARFERDVAVFLDEAEITGVSTRVTDTDRVLVASSAVMLVFGRPGWEYADLPEILIYRKPFDDEYRCSAHPTAGGVMAPRNAIILARSALVWSFRTDEPYHVGLHEFAHFVDLEDGRCDGVPRGLGWEGQRRWQELIGRELSRARRGHSVLGDYAATGEAELFAVAIEHFFKAARPLRARHPELYAALGEYLNQDPLRRA